MFGMFAQKSLKPSDVCGEIYGMKGGGCDDGETVHDFLV
jgi:hypothetical protein